METNVNSPVPDVVYITRSVRETIQTAAREILAAGKSSPRAGGILIGRRLEHEERVELLILTATQADAPVDIAYINQQLETYQSIYPNAGYIGMWYVSASETPSLSQEEVDTAHNAFADPAYKVKELVALIVGELPGEQPAASFYMNRAMANQRHPFATLPVERIREIADESDLVAQEHAADNTAQLNGDEEHEPDDTDHTPKHGAAPGTLPHVPSSSVSSPSSSTEEPEVEKSRKGFSMKDLFTDNKNMPVIAGAGLGILVLLIIIVVMVSRSGDYEASFQRVDSLLENPSAEGLNTASYELNRVQNEYSGARVSQGLAERFVSLGNAYLEMSPPKPYRAAVSYQNALEAVPGDSNAAAGVKRAQAVEWCGKADTAGSLGDKVDVLEAAVVSGIGSCPAGPAEELLYQARVAYIQELLEEGKFEQARLTAEKAGALTAEEEGTSEETLKALESLKVVHSWVEYDTAAQQGEWDDAVDALNTIVGVTGPNPDPEAYPPEEYGERITEVGDVLASARIAYAHELQKEGNIEEAEALYTEIENAEGVSSGLQREATQAKQVLKQGKKLWVLVDAAIDREDWGGMRQLLEQIRLMPGFGSESRDPVSKQTVEELARMGDTIMAQQTVVAMEEQSKTAEALIDQTAVAQTATAEAMAAPSV